MGFGACGTVRVNRRGMPKEFRNKTDINKGDVRAVEISEGLIALQWQDKRLVSMLSTIHNDDIISKRRRTRHAVGGREEIEKPVMIEQYNTYMGGVDKADQLLSYYGFNHRTIKWWKRTFFHLLDLAIVNSYILYKLSSDPSKQLSHQQFKIQLAMELLNRTGIEINDAENSHQSCGHSLPSVARLTERHFPIKVDHRQCGITKQLECVVCSFKKGRGRKTSTHKCKQCDVSLCIVPCFELYHTYVDPKRYLEVIQ